jgi:hypothetical protein
MRNTLCLLGSVLACPLMGSFASAASIDFTFKAVTAQVSFNGGPPTQVDLSIDLLADTTNLVRGGGFWGSDRYLNLKAFVSSKILGLSDVEAVTPLSVEIGAPGEKGPFRNTTVVLSIENVVNGIYAIPAIGGWNHVSSIGPLLGPATASGPLRLVLKNGSTLSINTLESVEPWGKASFQATVVPEAEARPTPTSIAGSLRKLGEKDLYLRTDSKATLRFRLIAKTQFRDQQGAAVRDSLLRAGDHISVSVNPDDPETAVGVVLVQRARR